MKKIKWGSLIPALAIAFILTGGMMYYSNLKSLNKQGMKVVVAAVDIKENAVISETQLVEKSISKQDLVLGYASSKKDIVGKIAKDNIYKNQQISNKNLVQASDKDKLSVTIPKGYRAVTVKVDKVSGVGGHIKTGDFVDVIAFIQPPDSKNKEVRMIFQSIEVIDDGSKENSSQEESYMTLCMRPVDAERLFLMGEISKIKFMLKSPIDKEIQSIRNVNFNGPVNNEVVNKPVNKETENKSNININITAPVQKEAENKSNVNVTAPVQKEAEIKPNVNSNGSEVSVKNEKGIDTSSQ